MLLGRADAVGDGGRSDAELLAGKREAPVPGGSLEEAQAFERGKCCIASVQTEPSDKTQLCHLTPDRHGQ